MFVSSPIFVTCKMLFICIVHGDEHVCLCQIKSFDFDFVQNMWTSEHWAAEVCEVSNYWRNKQIATM